MGDEHQPAWCGHAFGLRVTAPVELETLSACDAPEPERQVAWSRTAERGDLFADWSSEATERLLEYRTPDGRPWMSIDTDAASAYLVEAPGYGAHAISSDGSRITSLLARDSSWAWQRLFVAQVLPLTAAIRGLEPLHASAVAFGGRAVAFSAPSGTGKTSLVMQLVAGGRSLVTDDILAIEAGPTEVLAHPGARLLNAARHELDELGGRRERLGDVLDEGEKVYLRPDLEPGPLPLAALYRLARDPSGTSLSIGEEVPPDARSVLGTVFLRHLRSPERLTRRLELMAQVAQTARLFSVHTPSGLSAAETATLLERHMRDELGLET
jgi:hypothetical protein